MNETKSLPYCTFNRKQQSKTTTDPYNVWGKKKRREEENWEVYGLNLGCLLVLQELQSQAVLSWQVDTIIYSSVQGHFTDWWIRPRARGVADSGALGLLFGYWGCVCSPLSLSSTPSTASTAILDPERGGGGGTMRTKREQEEEVGKGEGRSDELSVAWEEGRAQGYDWLLAGSEFKANAQAPALCNGGRKGDVGHRKGPQTRKAGLGERKWGKKEKRRKKNPLKGFWNVQISVVDCSFRCSPLIIKHATTLTH